MSATGRGRRLGGPEDFYATPAWCVDRLLEELDLPGGLWVEPGAGNGSIIRAVNTRRADVRWLAVEVRTEERPTLEDSASEVVIGDFLTLDMAAFDDRPAVVIGNPPYKDALAFIQRALDLYRGAFQAYLLRIPFASSADRAPLMRARPPSVYVLPDRPAFRNDGSDNTDYAWFVWPPACGLANLRRGYGLFRVLATTSPAERDRKLIPAGRTLVPAQRGLFS